MHYSGGSGHETTRPIIFNPTRTKMGAKPPTGHFLRMNKRLVCNEEDKKYLAPVKHAPIKQLGEIQV